MEFCLNVPLSGEHQPEQVLSSKHAALSTTSLDDLFSTPNTEADVALEWLSVFVEDCLSSKGICLPPPNTTTTNDQTTKTASKQQPSQNNLLHGPKDKLSCLNKFGITGKARSKRKRIAATKTKNNNPLSTWSTQQQHSSFLHTPVTDPPLLHQTQWLADSELIEPKKDNNNNSLNSTNTSFSCMQEVKEVKNEEEEEEDEEEEEEEVVVEEEEKGILGIEKERDISGGGGQVQQPRRCTHCLSQRTPQWRAGPLGPKTLCNACGVRYKSGRLLPEYRPAKSPTFVSYLHSNSHKKVLEMRMQGGVHNLMSSIPSPK